jgi:cysteine synthase
MAEEESWPSSKFESRISKKDRVALAKRNQALRPNQTVVELTSGNTETGLAIVCGQTGHPFVAVMSRGNSMERARMMRALGAEVMLIKLRAVVPAKFLAKI